jgi:hypothetical protein
VLLVKVVNVVDRFPQTQEGSDDGASTSAKDKVEMLAERPFHVGFNFLQHAEGVKAFGSASIKGQNLERHQRILARQLDSLDNFLLRQDIAGTQSSERACPTMRV